MKKKIALVCIAKKEDDYLQEWIDYHLKLGFNSIHIFQNDWRFNNSIEQDNVYFHEWDGETPLTPEGEIWEQNIQAKCYTDFSRNYYEEYEWAAFFDVDEFLVLKKTNDVKEFIAAYDSVNCVAINWAMFGDSGLPEPDGRGVIDRFTMRKNGQHGQFKSICKLSPILCHQIHFSNDQCYDLNFNMIYNGFNPSGNFDIAQLNHYFTKTYPEFVYKRNRGNACGSGEDRKRPMSNFEENNFNEVEDLHAKNFFNNQIN